MFRVADNSLFAILLRSPWWVSFLVAGGIFALARLWLPEVYAIIIPLPFMVIGGVAAWKQLRAPSAAQADARLERLRAMSWEEFSAAIEEAFRREGYSVNRPGAAKADLELVRSGRVTLVGCKRWKAARAGVEPLRELDAARRAHDAHECIFVAAGEVSDNARAFAAANNVRLLHGAELAQLLARA